MIPDLTADQQLAIAECLVQAHIDVKRSIEHRTDNALAADTLEQAERERDVRGHLMSRLYQVGYDLEQLIGIVSQDNLAAWQYFVENTDNYGGWQGAIDAVVGVLADPDDTMARMVADDARLRSLERA